MGNEEMFASPLWQCERCGAWVSQGDDGGAWRWTGTAWEHSGHSDLPPQAGHFPARHFATVADAIAHATATLAQGRVAALTERVQRLDAVVQAYEAQARAEGRALVCRGCAGAGVLDGVLCGDCHGAGTIAAKGAV